MEYRNGTESGNKYYYNSTLPPLSSEEKTDKISSGNEYDAESMYTDMLEDIHDRSQYQPSINERHVRYKICD